MVVDFIIMIVVVDVVVRIDGEDVRFVAIASMAKEYHAIRKIQPKFQGNVAGCLLEADSLKKSGILRG